MLNYRALIIDNVTGKRRTIKLGRASSISKACQTASDKCPDGWTILDVSKS